MVLYILAFHIFRRSLFPFLVAGMVWSVRRWSRPAISWSLPSVNQRSIACSSPTCCSSAAPGLISPSHASVPAETTWKARWRCARTAYNTRTPHTLWQPCTTNQAVFETRRTGQDRTVTLCIADSASVLMRGDAIKEFRVIQLLFYSHTLTNRHLERKRWSAAALG